MNFISKTQVGRDERLQIRRSSISKISLSSHNSSQHFGSDARVVLIRKINRLKITIGNALRVRNFLNR